jgi:hypothetical protein
VKAASCHLIKTQANVNRKNIAVCALKMENCVMRATTSKYFRKDAMRE